MDPCLPYFHHTNKYCLPSKYCLPFHPCPLPLHSNSSICLPRHPCLFRIHSNSNIGVPATDRILSYFPSMQQELPEEPQRRGCGQGLRQWLLAVPQVPRLLRPRLCQLLQLRAVPQEGVCDGEWAAGVSRARGRHQCIMRRGGVRARVGDLGSSA